MMANTVAEARFEEAPTWVCWDIENCPVPKGCKPEEIADKIKSALRKLNYRGPIFISAYGNRNHIPPSVKKALSSTGINLTHLHVNSRVSRSFIFYRILYWSGDNPAPANLMLISRDQLLSPNLTELQSKGYNVLLAHPTHSPDSLFASAKTTWLWKSLLKGS